MIINPVKITGATVGNAYSGNTLYIEGILTTIRCKFTTASTTFVLTINDSDGIPIFSNADEPATGEMVWQVRLAVRGIYTIVISGASANEAFTCKLEVEE